MLVRIFLAAGHAAVRERAKAALRGHGVLLSVLGPEEDFWSRVGRESVDLVVVDDAMLGITGVSTLGTLRTLPSRPEILILESGEDEATRAEFLAGPALAVLGLHIDDDTLRRSLLAVVERRRESLRLGLRSSGTDHRLGDFLTASPVMNRLLAVARRVAESDTTLLLLGETGVGKEWLARGIHGESRRRTGPFLAVNCGAIPEGLMESELFGHQRGAFTGAESDRRGHFELAHGGTLFLDEIGEAPPAVQVKLLRALQDRRIQPVGSEQSIDVDVRVVAATNRDPEEQIRSGHLRADLFYRLSVVTLTLPPLRERREDIDSLVERYFEAFRVRLGRPVYGITPDVRRRLVEYDWPGNVRELINVMERAVLLCEGEEITLEDLPEEIARGPEGGFDTSHGAEAALDESWLRKPMREARRDAVADFERRYLGALLARTGGRVSETARQAGITPRALFDRMRQLGLRKEDFRSGGPGPDPAPPAGDEPGGS